MFNLSKSLSDGEQLLNKAHSTAAEGLTDLEAKAGKINTTVGGALDVVNTVVDLNAEILETLLQDKGIQYVRAENGKEALNLFAAHPEGSFDAILMDIMMPEMDGYEATRRIRSMKDRLDGEKIPIIAMTANAFAEDMQASLAAGMNAHLTKPIEIDSLIRTISNQLKK